MNTNSQIDESLHDILVTANQKIEFINLTMQDVRIKVGVERRGLISDTICDIIKAWSSLLSDCYEAIDSIDVGNSVRTPDAIKKELKHAKNPMEIKRLNKELTTYYKDHKKSKNYKGGSK